MTFVLSGIGNFDRIGQILYKFFYFKSLQYAGVS